MGKHSPIYLWNQVIPMAYPKLGRCVQFHPLQKFKAVHGEDAFLMVEEYPLDGDLVDEFDEKYTRLAYGEIHYDECKNKELVSPHSCPVTASVGLALPSHNVRRRAIQIRRAEDRIREFL